MLLKNCWKTMKPQKKKLLWKKAEKCLIFIMTIRHEENLTRFTTIIENSWTLFTKNRKEASNKTFRKDYKSSMRSEEHTSELQSRENIVCRLLLEKKN